MKHADYVDKSMFYAKQEKETTLHGCYITALLASEVGIFQTKLQTYIDYNRVHARVRTCLKTASSFR